MQELLIIPLKLSRGFAIMKSKFKRLPQHIAVIPDGNRRWASEQGLKKSEGYQRGLEPGISLYEQCLALGW